MRRPRQRHFKQPPAPIPVGCVQRNPPRLDHLGVADDAAQRFQRFGRILGRMIDRQQRAFVDIALSGLSKRDRKFAELYFGEAKSPDDIAKEMGVSVSTVYSKKAKIKTRLQSLARAAA